VGAIAGRRVPAQVRDLGAVALRHLPDGLAGLRLDLLAVELELDLVAHRRSSGKNLNTDLSGLGAAWPRPQMEESPITCARSASRSASHVSGLISFTAFSVPLRQGVHCPQLSSSKNFMRLSATSFMSSLSDRMTTAWLPTKQPYFSSWPKSSGRLAM